MRLWNRLFGGAYKGPHESRSNVSSFVAYDKKEFAKLAKKAWTLCQSQSLHQAAHDLYGVLHNKAASPGARLRFMALLRELADSGFQVAAIAIDHVFRASPIVRRLEEKAKTAIRWIPLMDPAPRQSGQGIDAEAYGRRIIRDLQSALSHCDSTQILVSGGTACWLFECPPGQFESELGRDYEVQLFATTDWHDQLRNLSAIRKTIARSPLKKHIFIAPLPGCPWFPLDGPISATTSLFPVVDATYSASVFMYGMLRWDCVLEVLATNLEGIYDVEYSCRVFIETDPELYTPSYEAIKAARSDSEKAVLLAQQSCENLDSARKQDFDYNRRYVGSLGDMVKRVNKAVALAQNR